MAISKKIKLKIITPERIVFEKDIFQATLPVVGGIVTILPNHRSYIGALKTGEIILKNEKDSKNQDDFAVAGGFVEFHENEMVILADKAEHASEIDIERAEEARDRAEIAMKEKIDMSDMEYARVAAELEKNLMRLKIAKKHNSRKRL